MFCMYCGNKLETQGKACPFCGREQEPLSSTNGFFGVLEYTESCHSMHGENVSPIKERPPKVEIKKNSKVSLIENPIKANKNSPSLIISVIYTAAIMVVVAICTGIIASKFAEIRDMQKELLQEIQAVESSTESNRESVESLAKQVEDLQQEQEKQGKTLKETQVRLTATPSPSPQSTIKPEENEPKSSKETNPEELSKEEKQTATSKDSMNTPKPTTGDE